MCLGMANGGKTKVDKVENFIRETNEWHRVAELNANEIIRLQAENDRLNNELHSKVEYIHEQLEIIENKKAEIERLKNEIAIQEHAKCLPCIEETKIQAIKEFAERLKEKAYLNDGVTGFQDVIVEVNDIDNLVKEMVGDEE